MSWESLEARMQDRFIFESSEPNTVPHTRGVSVNVKWMKETNPISSCCGEGAKVCRGGNLWSHGWVVRSLT